MKKKISNFTILIIICFFILDTINIYSQNISIMSIDYSNYPLMKAKIFVFDKSGSLLTGLDKSQFTITENNEPVNILDISCPEAKPPEAVSSVLTIDQSGSMTGNGITIAQNAASVWVNGLPLGKSECALTGFDDKNYLYSDFTTDRNKLLNLIKSIQAMGGTDFNAALINQMAGAVLIAKDGQFKKVIVLLTDGMADGNIDEIVNEANKNSINIYSVVLGNQCPEVLKTISQKTGGQYFDNITTTEQAETVYKAILQAVQGGSPCEIEWYSNTCNAQKSVEISIPEFGCSITDSYTVPISLLPAISISSNNSYIFESTQPNKLATASLSITASNKPITIDTVTSSNSMFGIKFDGNFPISINPNSSVNFTLSYLPSDSSYQFSVIKFISNACVGNTFYASGGYYYSPSDHPTIKVTFPNGGERFAASSDSIITWEGVPPEDTVRIEYSSDKGQTWNLVSDTAVGLKQKWNIPNIESSDCLVKIAMLNSSLNVNKSLSGHTDFVSQISWCPSSDNLTSVGEDRKARILSSISGKVLNNITSPYIFKSCSWSSDSKKIAYSLSDNSIIIVNPSNGSITNTLTGNPQWSYFTTWVPDEKGSNDSLLIAASNDAKIYVWNISNSASPYKIIEPDKGIIQKIQFNKNDDRLYCLTESDGRLFYIDNWLNSPKCVELEGSQFFPYLDFSINEARNEMLASRQGKDLSIIDLSTFQVTKSIDNTPAKLVNWSKNGMYAAYTLQSQSQNVIKIYDILQDSPLTELDGHQATITDIEWKKDNRTIASSSYDNSIKIWYFDNVLQKDVSDSLFIISIPSLSSKDVNFGNVTANTMKDSLISDYFINNSSVQVKIDSVTLSGNDKTLFKIAAYNPPYYIEPKSTKSFELQFIPTYPGLKQAIVNIYYSGKVLTQRLSGTGIKQEINLCNNYIDFGKMLIGSQKDSLAAIIKNIDTAPIVIDSVLIAGPDTSQFKILDNSYLKTVPVNQYLELNLSFNPLEKGRTSTKLLVYYNSKLTPAETQLFGTGLSECGDYSFTFAGFPSANGLSFVESSFIESQELVLTDSHQQLRSAAWYYYPVPVQRGFKTTFSFTISHPAAGSIPDGSALGADGLAFVIQNNSNISIGGSGGGLGYESIPNSLAVEIDLFANDNKQIENRYDPDGNHVAVQSLGIEKNSSAHNNNATLGIKSIPFPIRSDSTKYYGKIEYNLEPNTLKVYIDSTDKLDNPLITLNNIDLSKKLNLINNDMAYIGFTAATGDSYQKQIIESWKFCTASDVVSVPESPEQDNSNEIVLYPNPARDLINLKMQNINVNKIVISDLLGNTKYEKQAKYGEIEWNSINVNDLNTGTYIIYIYTDSKTIIRKFNKY